MDPSVHEFDLQLPDGRNLHGYDRVPADGPVHATVYWHGGSPNLGAPPEPLFGLADRLGVRWLGHDRPGYGRSTLTAPGRTVADVAADFSAVCDSAGVTSCAVMGHSGGGPHALACAALLPHRVSAVASMSSAAPYAPAEFDFFAGMGDPGPLRAATQGRAGGAAHPESPDVQPPFTAADWAALERDWNWVLSVVLPALEGDGPEALIDDDVAFVSEWGVPLAEISAPVLIVHGSADEMVPVFHAHRLSQLLPTAELRVAEGEGHVSVLRHAEAAMPWVVAQSP